MREETRAQLDDLLASDDNWVQALVNSATKKRKVSHVDPLLSRFEEINRFIDQHGHLPDDSADNLKESALGARLKGILSRPADWHKLSAHDRHSILKPPCSNEPLFSAPEDPTPPESLDDLLDDPLFVDDNNISATPRALRPSLLSHKRDVWQRQPCEDFAKFKLKFKTIENGLSKGSLVRSPLIKGSKAQPGDIFLWRGLLCFVEQEAGLGDHDKDGRIRIIFSNGTESWMKPSSVTRHFYALKGRGEKNAHVERIVLASEAQPDNLPQKRSEETATGYIYVARTLSDNPSVIPHKKRMVKIGCTSGNVAQRIASAERDPTFLLARAKVVRTFTLTDLDPFKVEAYLHQKFSHRQLDIEITDRFGKPVRATEWFAISPAEVGDAIEELIEKSKTDI
jgi:hypothetical protein